MINLSCLASVSWASGWTVHYITRLYDTPVVECLLHSLFLVLICFPSQGERVRSRWWRWCEWRRCRTVGRWSSSPTSSRLFITQHVSGQQQPRARRSSPSSWKPWTGKHFAFIFFLSGELIKVMMCFLVIHFQVHFFIYVQTAISHSPLSSLSLSLSLFLPFRMDLLLTSSTFTKPSLMLLRHKNSWWKTIGRSCRSVWRKTALQNHNLWSFRPFFVEFDIRCGYPRSKFEQEHGQTDGRKWPKNLAWQRRGRYDVAGANSSLPFFPRLRALDLDPANSVFAWIGDPSIRWCSDSSEPATRVDKQATGTNTHPKFHQRMSSAPLLLALSTTALHVSYSLFIKLPYDILMVSFLLQMNNATTEVWRSQTHVSYRIPQPKACNRVWCSDSLATYSVRHTVRRTSSCSCSSLNIMSWSIWAISGHCTAAPGPFSSSNGGCIVSRCFCTCLVTRNRRCFPL